MKVSIIVPNRNYAKYLPDCLDSIASQTYQNIEVLLADGNSDDGSIEILEEYSTKYGWKIYSREDNGQVDAINRGLQLATGDIQCWLNSDDLFLSRNALQVAVDIFQDFPSVDIISLGGYYTDANGHWLRSTKLQTHPLFRQTDIAMRGGGLIQPSTFWKPSLFKEFGLSPEFPYSFDSYFFIQCCRKFNMLIDQSINISGYRLHDNNLSVGVKPQRVVELANLNANFFGHGFRYMYLKILANLLKLIDFVVPSILSRKIMKIIYMTNNFLSYTFIYRIPSI